MASAEKASAEMRLYEQTRRYYRMLAMTVHNVLPHEPAPGDAELYGRFYRACDLLIVHNDASKQELKDLQRKKLNEARKRMAEKYGDEYTEE